MRLSDLERWLCRHGWQPEAHNKPGSHRAWSHPAYRQRLTYGEPHGRREGQQLRPDVIEGILRDLEAMTPRDDGETSERESA